LANSLSLLLQFFISSAISLSSTFFSACYLFLSLLLGQIARVDDFEPAVLIPPFDAFASYDFRKKLLKDPACARTSGYRSFYIMVQGENIWGCRWEWPILPF